MARAYKDVCPCKDCDKRVFGCHKNCTRYNEWKLNSVTIKKSWYYPQIDYSINIFKQKARNYRKGK